MFIPGIVSATFKTMNAEEVISLTSEASLKAIEWSENHHVRPGDTKTATEIAKMTSDCGIAIAGYGSYYRAGKGMDIIPSLDNAKAMGATSIRIWAGSDSSFLTSEVERKNLVDDISSCVRKAYSYGIKVNTEWHRKTLTDTNESALNMLKEVGDSNFGTLWQPSPDMCFEERCKGLSCVKNYLSYFHVYYWDESGRRPLGEGSEYWKRYFSIPDNEKEYYALLEFVKGDSIEQFYDDANVLKGLCGLF